MNNELVFVDANVLLETVLPDRRFAKAADRYLSTHDTILSPLTAHLLIYFGKKENLALENLLTVLSKNEFTDFSSAEINWAIRNRQGEDFEDALQVACAILNGCHTFVTFDKNLAKNYQKYIDIELLPRH